MSLLCRIPSWPRRLLASPLDFVKLDLAVAVLEAGGIFIPAGPVLVLGYGMGVGPAGDGVLQTSGKAIMA